VAGRGPLLAAVASVERARLEAIHLRRVGLSVAVVPQEWARAAAGVDVVIGARAAAWAPCPDLAGVAIVDEHDEALQEERSPTWHARDVLLERARRAGAAALVVSPCPTVVGLAAAQFRVTRAAAAEERASWPIVEVVDRSRDEPWKTSLVTSPLVRHLRDADRTVVCVHNTPGRARILACRTCRNLARCETCQAAVALDDDGRLTCRRCGTTRPPVCLECGGSAFANLRPGVTRLREELEAAAGRPVVAVTGGDEHAPAAAGVYVGTEAVLHRVHRADTVAFLDIDRELLAPRYRAAEQAMALLVRGARLTGPRAGGGRVLVQTFLPRHDVIRAALLADPGRLVAGELARRQLLELPPFGALASVTGSGSDEVVAALRSIPGVTVGGSAGDYLARAASWDVLGRALIAAPRPRGSRVRVVVDPPRR
jgi:primosomal protein N' (replication factor Y) (superfamily II helicase)